MFGPAVLCILIACSYNFGDAASCNLDQESVRWKFSRVNFTVWTVPNPLTPDPPYRASIELTVPDRVTFYQVMQIAQVADTNFRFEFRVLRCGTSIFITSINGMKEEPLDNKHWFLYRLTGKPNPDDPPAIAPFKPHSVNETLTINDGDQFLFWLRYFPLKFQFPDPKC